MITYPPSEERFEELVAQVEYQGGDGAAMLCRPRYFSTLATVNPPEPSQEAFNDDSARARGLKRSPVAHQDHTCSCGHPTRLTIGYKQADERSDTYTACAVCDAVHLQPRFN